MIIGERKNKNEESRFVGVIIVIYPNGQEEKCYVKERKKKGKQNFIETVARHMGEIIIHSGKGTVEVKYKGDCKEQITDFMGYLKRNENRLIGAGC